MGYMIQSKADLHPSFNYLPSLGAYNVSSIALHEYMGFLKHHLW
jgi:hypothetical protein